MIYTHTVQHLSNQALDVECEVDIVWDDAKDPNNFDIYDFHMHAVNPDNQVYVDAYLQFIETVSPERDELLTNLELQYKKQQANTEPA